MSAPTRGRAVSRFGPARRPRPETRPRPGTRSRATGRPRTVDAETDGDVTRRVETVADGISGVLSAVQAAMLSLAVVVLPAFLARIASTASGSGTGDGQTWRTPAEIASAIWLLGHGVPVTASGATVTLVPLGLTALAVFACNVTARHAARASLRTWIAATVAYATVATTVAAAVPGVAGWSLLVVPPAGALVGGLGFGLGTLARAGAPTPAELGDRLDHLARGWCPPTLRLGARAGLVATGLLAGLAALLVGVWAVAGRATSSDIIRGLDPGWTGGIVLAVAQLTLLPDLVLWAMAWLSGTGFAVGSGTSFTPFGADPGPLPAVPLLAALPGQDWTGSFAYVVPLSVVACGAVAGWFAWRRLEPGLLRWYDVAVVLGGLAGVAGLLVGLLQAAASGAVGAARLSDVGATPWLTALLTAGEMVVGAAAVLLPHHLASRPRGGTAAPGT
ncbi:cell division protein PerM [Myceligenerans indicum]|uniref:Integral membrane protein n=1 Tax=Myceligenerans indicum TaxID=2593663 RepID=A0ABS1LEU2_9MICO|nr:DUF6350 family protein [Myceligenerans indicum]MBL0884734.1 hypothetical protein [Myceligenerans indicum]